PAGEADLASSLTGLGSVLTKKGRANEAEPLLREGLEIRKKVLAQGDWRIALTESVLGSCSARLGRHDQAEPRLLGGYAALHAAQGAPPWSLREGLDSIIQLYESWDRPEEAQKWRAQRAKLVKEGSPKQ